MVKLDWSQVDLARRCAWIHADQAKTRKAIPVPLNAEAVLVLRQQEGKHPDRVFTYKGKPVTKANNHAWRKALVRAGIEDFRWHDLRHTWASWHVQQGTPLHVLQELGGWSDYEMVRRYAHLSVEHLAKYADDLSEIRLVSTNLTRIFHPLLAFPGSQWMEDVVPRTGRGKAREGLFSRLQAHLPLTPLFVNVPGQHSPEVILAPVAQPRCRTGVDKGKRLREGTGFAGYCARRSRQL